MLPGVHGELAAAERRGQPAEPGPGLEQFDLAPGGGQVECRRDAGQTAADDADPGHRPGPDGPSPDRALAAITAFCRTGSDSRPPYTREGWAAIRSSSAA